MASWRDALLPAALAAGTIIGSLVGQGGLVRLVYPAAACLIAARMFLTGRHAAYLVFCLWLFVITPGLRRYVDFDAGFVAVNVVMLAPWLAASFSLVLVLRALRGPAFPLSNGLLLVVAAASYGLVLAALNGRLIAGVFDWLRWSVPPCFGALGLLTLQHPPDIERRLLHFINFSAILLGGYGLWQFLTLPGWDAFWMQNVQLRSFGDPLPYLVHVFSLMNSPGALANYLVVAILYLFVFASPRHLAALALGSVALLLSLVRSAWGALALSLLYVAVIGPAATKLRTLLTVGAVLLSLLVIVSVVPEAAEMLDARYESISDLSSDTSYHQRLDAYVDFLRVMDENITGQGLAVTGAAQTSLSGHSQVFIDGEIIEVYTELGAFVGTLYLGAALCCLASAARRGALQRSRLGLASSAAVLSAFMLLPYGSPLVGEIGIVVWLAAGICVAPAAVARGRAGRCPRP